MSCVLRAAVVVFTLAAPWGAPGSAAPDGPAASGGGAGGSASVITWFRADFSDLNANGSKLYNFANRSPQSATTWETRHTDDQGWRGSPAPHVTIHGCAADDPSCSKSGHQFHAGWVTAPLKNAPVSGDRAYVRFRIKFDAGARFPLEKFMAKFILFGTTRTTPNSRWIIHLTPALSNAGGSLGFDYSYMGWAPPAGVWHRYGDWGLSGDFHQPAVVGRYASFQSNVNIGWSCNPGVLVTASDHPGPVPKPQATGSAAVDGWTHLQFEAVSGPDGKADFRTWANAPRQSAPSSERLDMPDGLGVIGWQAGVNVVGYWGTADMPDLGFILDDFEIGPDFDPGWAP